LHTLCAVDVATGWLELQPVWSKGHRRVKAALHEIRGRLPIPLCGLDSDNGSEFINRPLYYYCLYEGITFTRSRPYRKNDSAHVEQKNGAVVRALVAMIAMLRAPLIRSLRASIGSCVYIRTSFNRYSVWWRSRGTRAFGGISMRRSQHCGAWLVVNLPRRQSLGWFNLGNPDL
jgi:hypothetical protein